MNKFNKGKLIGVVTASLSAVSLMGVGFATWIIQGVNTIDTNDQIKVEVSGTEDQRVVLDNAQISWPSGKTGLVFDAKSDDNTAPIIYNGTNGGEQLDFTLSFDVKFATNASFASVNAYMTSDWGDFETYFTDSGTDATKYVVSPISVTTPTETNGVGSTIVANKNSITTKKEGAADTYTVKQNYSFTWGKFFDNKNPCEVTAGSDKVDSYIGALKTLQNFNNKHITIHLGVKIS